MGNFRENLASALRALRESWVRSSLTMLGIIIGVGSVVLLVAIGQGVKQDVTTQIESLGTNIIIVVPGKLDRSGQPNPMSTLGISPLTEQDVTDLGKLSGVRSAVPVMFVFGSIERNKQTASAIVLASTPQIFDVRPYPFEEGRFFRKDEEHKRVCVLAHDPKTEAFGDRKAVGKSIRVRGVDFEVVGVLAPEKESVFGAAMFSNSVYVPLEAARDAYKGGQINRIIIMTDYNRPPDRVISAIKGTLLINHASREDFGLLTQEQILSAIYRVFNIVTSLVAGISAISLVVAGIGIMNIMLVTVTERTREIGIRKTVGARRADIFLQFLTEAVILACLGGVIGTTLAVIICKIVAANTALKPLVTPAAVIMAFGVCGAVGIVFGLAPAMRAARQDPIDALRWE
jgi:putative ABC transport system permease protein